MYKYPQYKTNPLHVIGKCDYDRWPHVSMTTMWDLFGDILDELQETYDLHTHAFVLMSNHYHWLCHYEGVNEDKGLFDWTHEIINIRYLQHTEDYLHLFAEPPYVGEITSYAAYRKTYAYIYRNPVSAGLVPRAEEYAYSTLPYILRGQRLPFFCEDHLSLILNPSNLCRWINSSSASIDFR